MDLRTKKTLQALHNAFLELRAHKALEKITVKEISERAQISKATFYLHYRDIYDLSDHLQHDVIQNIFQSISHPEAILNAPAYFTRELFHAFSSQYSLIQILFAGSQASVLPFQIENTLRKQLFEMVPQIKDSPYVNVLLTYEVQGCYYAYLEHTKNTDMETILDAVTTASEAVTQKIHEYCDQNGISKSPMPE